MLEQQTVAWDFVVCVPVSVFAHFFSFLFFSFLFFSFLNKKKGSGKRETATDPAQLFAALGMAGRRPVAGARGASGTRRPAPRRRRPRRRDAGLTPSPSG